MGKIKLKFFLEVNFLFVLQLKPGGSKIDWEYLLTKYVYRRFSVPLAKILARLGVKPVSVTIFATFIGIVSAYLFAVERFYEGAVILFIS